VTTRDASEPVGDLTPVARLDEVPDPGLLGVATATGERVCLIRCGGELLAVADECPHQAFPLSAGEVHGDGTLECVWHGARFDCRSGDVRRGPATDPLVRYAVRVVDGVVMLGGREP
jgi:3-phenylpropionate/trans-cinnamate dioxygenase ferredoxin component